MTSADILTSMLQRKRHVLLVSILTVSSRPPTSHASCALLFIKGLDASSVFGLIF